MLQTDARQKRIRSVDTPEKVRLNKLRRMADRQGLKLVKSKRRDPLAVDYNLFWLVDKKTNNYILSSEGMTLPDIERYLLRKG